MSGSVQALIRWQKLNGHWVAGLEILAEAGIRCGEACGLPTRNLLLDLGALKITQKVWHGKVDSMMVGNAEKGQNGKFFIQFSFSFPF